MITASAVELRRLVAAMWSLGFDCALPCGKDSRSDFVLQTLLKLQYIINPPGFAFEEGDTNLFLSAYGFPSMPARLAAAAATTAKAAKTPKERLQLLQHAANFLSQETGITLDIPVLLRADGAAISELLRLAEPLAAATKASLETEASGEASEKRAECSEKGEKAEQYKGLGEAFDVPNEQHARNRSSAHIEAAKKVQSSVDMVTASLQCFYGEQQAAERIAMAEFTQAVVTPDKVSREASSLCGRALLEQHIHEAQHAVVETEKNNEALACQVQELKRKIHATERDEDRLTKQLLLLRRSQGSGDTLEDEEQQEMQEKLRQLYLEYARRSAVCDTLMASVEDIANRAEAAAAQNRRRLREARQRWLVDQATAASGTEAQSNCIDTFCSGMSEDIGMTLATSEHMCTESSELD
ncbi:hypothetical protein cyc_01952 [Cyclospora cayetanensis]|uniref:Uncharacterized protein n=1 Tax=Cyclospora cayetanensis TaxID=88456 RepID=A0A1D3CVR8_9EIME|nr:hypothetical protein cyc_01952 [Cyclospora cayetanensis]